MEINIGIKEFFVNIALHKSATRRVLLHRHHRDPQRRSDKCDLHVLVVLFLFYVCKNMLLKMNADCLLHKMYAGFHQSGAYFMDFHQKKTL